MLTLYNQWEIRVANKIFIGEGKEWKESIQVSQNTEYYGNTLVIQSLSTFKVGVEVPWKCKHFQWFLQIKPVDKGIQLL